MEIQETGIILEVTPHLTAGNLIRMQIRAERSGIQLLDSDLGVNFNVQEAETSMLIEDGETAVIGGLTVTEITETPPSSRPPTVSWTSFPDLLLRSLVNAGSGV